jgi:hypothetical protein
MTVEPTFHTELSAPSRLASPVPGLVARFDLADGRRVAVHLPHALTCRAEACTTDQFRIEVRRADDSEASVLTAADLVDVFGARTAAQALAAFAAGDVERSDRLAQAAGGAWQWLTQLVHEVSVAHEILRQRGIEVRKSAATRRSSDRRRIEDTDPPRHLGSPLPPIPDPPQYPPDPRQLFVKVVIACLTSGLPGGKSVAEIDNPSGYPASAVDLARLQTEVQRAARACDLGTLRARINLDLGQWLLRFLRAWVQRCKSVDVEADLESECIVVHFTTEDDEGAYSYAFDVFPGIRPADDRPDPTHA